MSNQSQFRIRIICKYKIKSIKICLTSNTVNLYRYMYVCLCFDDLQKKKDESLLYRTVCQKDACIMTVA